MLGREVGLVAYARMWRYMVGGVAINRTAELSECPVLFGLEVSLCLLSTHKLHFRVWVYEPNNSNLVYQVNNRPDGAMVARQIPVNLVT
jgi:hypothetical protein